MKFNRSFTALLLAALCFAAAGCQKEIPPELQAQSVDHSPYASVNHEQQFYLSIGLTSPGIVYGDALYVCSNSTLQSIELPNYVNDSDEKEGVSLCSDPMCAHIDLQYPAMMRHPNAEFLIDVTESDGELPVIYYFRCMAGQDDTEWNDLRSAIVV